MSDLSHSLRRYPELDGKTFLVCIGGMKCATSWVYHYLATLPGVQVSPLKELHFFDAKFSANALGDVETLAARRVALHLGREGDPAARLRLGADFQASVDRMQMIYDDNAYFGHFARIATDETNTLCDITPAYCAIGPAGFAYMAAFFATQNVRLKLLFILRDPMDRLWSQLRHLQEINPDGRVAERWQEALTVPKVMARADYAGCLDDLDRAIPRDDVLCLFYEDLFHEASLTALCRFAGVAYEPADTATRHNETRLKRAIPPEAEAEFLRVLSPQYAACRERFGRRIPAAWRA